MDKAWAVAIAALAAGVAGCGEARGQADDRGPAVNRAYEVGAFDRIQVAGPYEVTVATGPAPSVRASGAQKDIERMIVEVDGQTLKIHARQRKGFNFGSWSNRETVRVQVTVPQLAAAGIAGSGQVAVDKVAGDFFNGEVAGSGNLSVGEMQVQKLKMAVAGSGEITANGGRAAAADYGIAGSGEIDAAGLVAEVAAVSIAGSGNVRANATGTAAVDIAGSGQVEVKGGARCTVSRAGSGDVRCS